MPHIFGMLIATPMMHLPLIGTPFTKIMDRTSITVSAWFDHMDAWRKDHQPDGITALVLHRPNLPYGLSTFVMSTIQLKEFIQRWSPL